MVNWPATQNLCNYKAALYDFWIICIHYSQPTTLWSLNANPQYTKSVLSVTCRTNHAMEVLQTLSKGALIISIDKHHPKKSSLVHETTMSYCTCLANTCNEAHEIHVCKLEIIQDDYVCSATYTIRWRMCHTQALPNCSSKTCVCSTHTVSTWLWAVPYSYYLAIPWPYVSLTSAQKYKVEKQAAEYMIIWWYVVYLILYESLSSIIYRWRKGHGISMPKIC